MNLKLPSPSLPLHDAAGARAGEEAAVAAGESWHGLMERAAGHLARGVIAVAGFGYGCKVAVIAGRGDNGGDGWAVARRLEQEHGARCWVVAVDGTDVDVSDATAVNRHRWQSGGGKTSSGTTGLVAALAWADVAVDAVLGTGGRGAPRGPAATAVAALAATYASGRRVVACDIPSGVAADDGTVASGRDGAVIAHRTVTFGGLKRGLLLHPGAGYAGEVTIGDLGSHYAPPPSSWHALTPAGVRPQPWDDSADKRQRGVVLVIAGSPAMTGAAALVAEGAACVGAGLVTVATSPDACAGVIARSGAHVMVRAFGDKKAAEQVLDAFDLAAYDTIVAGPGLGPSKRTQSIATQLLRSGRRVVLDADALNVFRDDPIALRADDATALVLTPHAGELARLGGDPANRAASALALAETSRAIVVAKGPATVVAAPDGRIWVCPLGTPALGSGGTGDVLAGMIGAAIATADDVAEAVARAVWWHAAAGEFADHATAGRATAIDVLAALPAVFRALETSRIAQSTDQLPWNAWRQQVLGWLAGGGVDE